MVLPAIFGIIILVIVIYIAFRILGNIILGLVLIGLVFLASFLIFGSIPDIQSIPYIGQYIPKLPTGGAVEIIRSVFYRIDALGVAKDAQGNLLVSVANRGRMDVSGFKVFVDGEAVNILNSPEDPLKSGHVTVLQLDWNKSFTKITVQTEQTSTSFISE